MLKNNISIYLVFVLRNTKPIEYFHIMYSRYDFRNEGIGDVEDLNIYIYIVMTNIKGFL